MQGEPRSLLDNLSICEENFDVAWILIENRYYNKRLISFQHVKHLLNLNNCTSGAFSNYRKLINEVNSNLAAVQNIQPGVELHELLLQELILNRIKSSHRSEWENKFSSSDTPSLNQLLEFLERKCQSLDCLT